MYRILMIDDTPAQLLPHRLFLQENGCTTDAAQTAGEAVVMLSNAGYDLILLDVRMPDISGFDLCGELRRLTDAPIVFLSSMAEDTEQIRGFSAGGVDYISKDCALELFWARVHACLCQGRQAAPMRMFPPLKVDLNHQRAFIGETDLFLTQTEFLLLSLLSSRPGMIWSVERLYREVWGENGPVNATLVQMHLSRMRCKIEQAFSRHEFVETVWGKGYQFVPMDACDNEK